MNSPIHDGGFCGLLDTHGKIGREQLPLPNMNIGPLWIGVWPAETGKAFCHGKDRIGLTFCGELFNAPSLRRELDTSDDIPLEELIWFAYRRWDLDFLGRLDGQFAVALWDGERCHLYRDGSGARSLFYSLSGSGQLAFATQLASLFRLPGVEKRIAHRSLHEYLRLLEIAAPNTMFENVQALEAGQLLTWSSCRLSSSGLPAASMASKVPANFDEAADTLDELLRQSIENRLDKTSHPAVFLSGGLDSSLLCAIATRVDPAITAVTVGFDGARYDETPLAAQVASHLGIRHEVLRYARQDYLDAFEQFAHGAEQPMADPAIPPTLLSLSHCRKHFDAVLDGSGVEESFGMMPPRHVRMGVEYAALLPAHLRLALAGAMRRLPGLSDYAPIFDFEHPAELMLRWHGFTRPEIESLCGQPVSFEHTFFYQTFWRFPRQAHYERYSALLGALTCDRLHHAAAITGMPVHYPYMNRDVDSYIKALPVNYRYLPGEPKRLLRALLARYVPREILDAPKHGFDFPLMTFLDAEDFELVRRYLRHGRWEQHALLSPRKVEDLGRRYMAGERHLMFRVWALVMLSAWLEGHGY